jgi:hypothetical protein
VSTTKITPSACIRTQMYSVSNVWNNFSQPRCEWRTSSRQVALTNQCGPRSSFFWKSKPLIGYLIHFFF